jgi:hypothetical protein
MYALALLERWLRPVDQVDQAIRRWATSHLVDRSVRYESGVLQIASPIISQLDTTLGNSAAHQAARSFALTPWVWLENAREDVRRRSVTQADEESSMINGGLQ